MIRLNNDHFDEQKEIFKQPISALASSLLMDAAFSFRDVVLATLYASADKSVYAQVLGYVEDCLWNELKNGTISIISTFDADGNMAYLVYYVSQDGTEILSLWVHPGMRGLGAGKFLLDTLLGELPPDTLVYLRSSLDSVSYWKKHSFDEYGNAEYGVVMSNKKPEVVGLPFFWLAPSEIEHIKMLYSN